MNGKYSNSINSVSTPITPMESLCHPIATCYRGPIIGGCIVSYTQCIYYKRETYQDSLGITDPPSEVANVLVCLDDFWGEFNTEPAKVIRDLIAVLKGNKCTGVVYT